ncbi:MAG: exodeoxyribonuclease VII large subunit [Acidimicrobiales bacterium]
MTGATYTVTELMTATAEAIKDRLKGPIWVDGELSGPRDSRGHFYFDLVDRDAKGAVVAKVPVALWSRARTKVEQKLQSAGTVRLEEGVKVRIHGPLELWLAGGRLQLSMQDIDPAFTLQALESERERVLAVLRSENLIDKNRMLSLPEMPLRVALITADESAAQADFMHSLVESGLPWQVQFIDSKVQGAGAERNIAAALRTAQRNQVDVIALVRGGGSRLDLAVFDHELVARTIATSTVPVFTGIGHEIDTSVADVVAFSASKTPTACAESLVALSFEVVSRGERAWGDIAEIVSTALEFERERLARCAQQAALGARTLLTVERHRISATTSRLSRSAETSLRSERQDLDLFAARLSAVDPVRTLARGWSITRTSTGTIVRTSADVAVGDTLMITLTDGTVTSTATAID